jgi:hypothetical protein
MLTMRQLLGIACVVALFMYAGFASLYGPGTPALSSAGTAVTPGATMDLSPLAQALAATGAGLEEAVVAGRVEVASPSDRDRVVAALGWTGKTPKGEMREAQLYDRDGKHVLIIRWTLQGQSAALWSDRHREVRQVLALYGPTPLTTVQIGGQSDKAGELPKVAARALDAVQATDRQPWTDGRAASMAGRSAVLPPSPLGVNVQVAVRRVEETGASRVWVAWPALLQEY